MEYDKRISALYDYAVAREKYSAELSDPTTFSASQAHSQNES